MDRGEERASLPEHAILLLCFVALAVIVFLMFVQVRGPGPIVIDEATSDPAGSR